jgi:hypothetical protein
VPSYETKKLIEDLDRLKKSAQELRWADDSRFEAALKTLEGRSGRVESGDRFEDHVWQLLTSIGEVVAARAPRNPKATFWPDFLARVNDKTFIIEAKAAPVTAVSAWVEQLDSSLGAFQADAALLVVPDASEARHLADRSRRVRVIDPGDLRTCLLAASG